MTLLSLISLSLSNALASCLDTAYGYLQEEGITLERLTLSGQFMSQTSPQHFVCYASSAGTLSVHDDQTDSFLASNISLSSYNVCVDARTVLSGHCPDKGLYLFHEIARQGAQAAPDLVCIS